MMAQSLLLLTAVYKVCMGYELCEDELIIFEQLTHVT